MARYVDQTTSHDGSTEIIHASPNSKSTEALQLEIEVEKKISTAYFKTLLTDMGDKNTNNLQEVDRGFIDYLAQNILGLEVIHNIPPAQSIDKRCNGVISESSEIWAEITQNCDLIYSDQSMNNNNIFVKNSNRNFEDEIDTEEIHTSLKTISSDQFVFVKKCKQINEPNIKDEKKECSLQTITEIKPSKLVTEETHIQAFTTNQSSNKFPGLKTHDLKLTEKWQNLCETCNTIDKSRVPLCLWSQDDNNIYLNFNIHKIDNFRVNCTMQSITFNAQYKDESYTFSAMLYGFIRPKVTHAISVEGVRIKARKLYRGKSEWPRLFACKKIHNYVKHYGSPLETTELGIWTKAVNWLKMVFTGTMVQL